MAPRFLNAHIECLKTTMLPHAPDCRFTEEDVLAITTATGLDRVQILVWADNMRYRVVPDQRDAYLRSPSYTEKVCFSLSQNVERQESLQSYGVKMV